MIIAKIESKCYRYVALDTDSEDEATTLLENESKGNNWKKIVELDIVEPQSEGKIVDMTGTKGFPPQKIAFANGWFADNKLNRQPEQGPRSKKK